MIIDMHTHLLDKDIPSEAYWECLTGVVSTLSKKPPEKVRTWWTPQWDITGDLLVKDMDVGKIDKAVICALDVGLAGRWSGGSKSVEEQNRIYAEAAARHPSRLIAFVGVDPRRGPEAIRLLEKGVKEWNMKGLKLMPAAGFYPDELEYFPLYAKASELKIPILIHNGPEIFPAHSKYCRPAYVDEVAVNFPDLQIIIAHAGYCWWQEAAWIAGYKPNVWIDLAGWQANTTRQPVERLYKPIRSMIDIMGSPKLLFATDWPAYRAIRGMDYTAWVNALSNPPEEAKAAGVTLSDKELEAVLGGNAAQILGLNTK